jgi:ribosome modulation factor
MRSIESGRWTMMDDTSDLIALVHAQGMKAGRDPARSRLDCPFCNDRMDLCSAWLAGFSLGRMSRPPEPDPDPSR